MDSPTALTPEPGVEGDISSLSVASSFGSDVVVQEQTSISLSPSPLAVRTIEDSPFKPRVAARNPLQDILENINTNITPHKPLPNQTPLKSTPLLTPPSSNERPPTVALPSGKSLTSSQVPLTERILATSALYSQAIQKQQQKVHSHMTQAATQATATPPLVTDIRSQRPPHLTYHQLQQKHYKQQEQQQRVPVRPGPVSDAEVANDHINTQAPPPPAPLQASLPLTVVELPNNTETNEEDKEKEIDKKPPSPIVTIPKPDPLENPLNTTNVYINGLPLRWTDDDLYRLTRGFGAVKSVKMFTRHLEDKPSAYGFVLFNCVEDAERFIVTLRQHTQFHPSFAKTGKVPGTTNSKHAIADPVIPLPRDEEFADIAITGLPLDVDKQTLRALFSPQIIKASKFFHTAGTPRRLVGFVRLETQQAAEEIVDRLDGSNVLGWSEKLSVQILESGNPQLSDPGHSHASYAAQHSSTLSPFAPNAASGAHGQIPSLGVYQHQQVQMNDVVRLVDSMKLGQAQPLVSQQDPLPEGMPNRTYAGLTTLPVPMNSLSAGMNHVPGPLLPPQRQGVGLGIGMARPFTRVIEQGYGRLTSQESNPLQGGESLHQTVFQSARDTSDHTLYSLQAAVIAQDLVLGHDSPVPVSRPKPLASDETLSRRSQVGMWGLPIRVNPGSYGNEPLQMSHFMTRNPTDTTPAYGSPDNVQGLGGTYQTAKVPAPGLPLMASDRILSAAVGKTTSKEAVPILLPALTPTSPQGSSGGSSPITPTVGQLPEHPSTIKVETS
ncbi:hypothetical protein FRC17_007097 [Serendipita sp. 399]|nr:hypothetical protein FRC17_007097 [Serendipita sp. 399]